MRSVCTQVGCRDELPHLGDLDPVPKRLTEQPRTVAWLMVRLPAHGCTSAGCAGHALT